MYACELHMRVKAFYDIWITFNSKIYTLFQYEVEF